MAFPSGLYTDRPEKERGNCRQQETAVQCWFTAKGTAMPLILEKEQEYQQLSLF